MKLEEKIPFWYVWKCAKLGFPRIYFLARKSAHAHALTQRYRRWDVPFIINTETWSCTAFTCISNRIKILMYLYLLHLNYLQTTCLLMKAGPAIISEPSFINIWMNTFPYGFFTISSSGQWFRFINMDTWYL